MLCGSKTCTSSGKKWICHVQLHQVQALAVQRNKDQTNQSMCSHFSPFGHTRPIKTGREPQDVPIYRLLSFKLITVRPTPQNFSKNTPGLLKFLAASSGPDKLGQAGEAL
jgi:hypothetical protein